MIPFLLCVCVQIETDRRELGDVFISSANIVSMLLSSHTGNHTPNQTLAGLKPGPPCCKMVDGKRTAFTKRFSNQWPLKVLCNIHPFMHTFTHRRRCRPCQATAILSGAVRVRSLARGHLVTRMSLARDRTSNLPATSKPAHRLDKGSDPLCAGVHLRLVSSARCKHPTHSWEGGGLPY